MSRIENKLMALGLVLPPPTQPPPGVSLLELFGSEAGAHCRSAVGLAELPFNIPVEIEGEVDLSISFRRRRTDDFLRMSAFVVFDVDIHDVARYQDYMKMVKPALAAAGARYLAGGGTHEV